VLSGKIKFNQHYAEILRNVPQGPLPLRFSGVCPDANAQGLPTAHQFALAPDAQSGLNKILKLV